MAQNPFQMAAHGLGRIVGFVGRDRIEDRPASVIGLVRRNFELKVTREEIELSDHKKGRVIGFKTRFYYDNPRTARDVARFFQTKFLEAKRAAVGNISQVATEVAQAAARRLIDLEVDAAAAETSVKAVMKGKG